MKYQEALFKKGDIVTKPSNGFQRLIYKVDHDYRQGMMKVMYYYYSDEYDINGKRTGNFDYTYLTLCSQDHLVRWMKS